MRIFILTILFSFWGALGLSAQNVLFFDSKKGLSNSGVRNIYEDSRHNIWITTLSGLSRYDGVKMNVYRHEDGNPFSLLHDESTCVMEYDRNHLFVGTNSGVQMYDYETDKFTKIPIVSESGDTVAARVVSIAHIGEKRFMMCLTAGGHGELEVAKDGSMVFRRLTKRLAETNNAIPIQFFEDTKHNLWLVNARGQVYRKTQKGNLKVYDEARNVRKICQSTSGNLYAVSIDDGLYYYDKAADQFRQVATGADLGGAVYGFNAWTDGRMFICTDGGGLRVYDEKTGKVTLSTIKVSDFDLATSNVKDAICDSYGNVWVGIYWKGVMMKPVSQSAFEYVGQHSITKNTIGTNAIFSVAKAPNNKVWVVVDNDGLYQMSADGTSSTHWGKETNPEMPRSFTSACNVDASTVLLGTFMGGLWKMSGGRFSLLTSDISLIFDIQPAEEQGCYWIATVGNGIFYYNYATGKYIHYTPDWNSGDEGRRIIGNAYTYAVMPLGDKLFVGTSGGLTICHLEKNGIIKKESTNLLDGLAVRHFAVSADKSTVWIATNRGLVRMDVASQVTYTYTKENSELPVNGIESLCFAGHQLWIGTIMGLSCMDVGTEHFATFYADDGLQDNEFCRGVVLSMDGKIYFGGISGLTYFDTKGMERWRNGGHRLHLRLVDVLVDGKTVHKGDMSGSYEMLQGVVDDCARLDLCHTDNQFTLELDVIELNNQHVVYEYSVDGGEWENQGGNNSRIVFANLAPGVYHIKVRALAMGTMSEEREFVVTIHPAWYSSMWAKMAYLLLFLALCWFFYEYVRRQVRLRRVMARNRQQHELNEARMQFFMNISHEIRTPMTLILAPLEKMIGRDKDPERQRNYQLMKENSKRILRLINQMMDVRKIEQGKFLLDYHPVELVEFLQSIYDVFAANAQSRNIQYEFIHDVDRLQVYVDPDNMDKIVMNLLSNAFKFTPDGGKITLLLKDKGADFEVQVADSGVGIPDDEKQKVFERFYSAKHQNGYMGTGIGLNLTSLLVRLHKGTITIKDNAEGKGTLFVVNMPVGDESLRVIKQEALQEVQETPEVEENDTASLFSFEKPVDTHRKNALLVEDDEAIRQYVQGELSSDLVVQLCANGQEAWDYIVTHQGKVDIVISDVMMPVMDGMTLCQKLKSNFNTNHIPVVLVTALGSDADRIIGISNGADAYVSKPFNIDVLRTTVMQLLKSRQLLQGKYHGDKQQEEHIDKVEIESPDENLMKRVMKVINENMDNPELSVELVADKVGISRVHFYRKMKDLTGQAPRDFVKYVRLKEAARLLADKNYDITGVSVATGFKSLSAFSTSFKALYGLTPSEWVKQHEE